MFLSNFFLWENWKHIIKLKNYNSCIKVLLFLLRSETSTWGVSHDCDVCLVIFTHTAALHVSSPYLHLDPVVSVTQVLQVGGGVGLDGGEVMLQHVDDLRQLRVAPSKLPEGKEREQFQQDSFTFNFQHFLFFARRVSEIISFSFCALITGWECNWC